MRRSIPWTRFVAMVLAAAVACTALSGRAGLAQTPPAPAPSPDGVGFTLAFDNTLKLNADRTGEYLETRRIKVLGVAALRQIAQQTLQYIDGMQHLEIVAAFTEKPDGTQVAADPASFITRDGATGLGAVYLRDLKVVTVIFPNVAVGDTLVLTSRRTILSDSFAGQFEQSIPLPRTVPRADSIFRVIAPSNLPLKVGIQGEGLEQATAVQGSETRHVITYHARPAVPVEAGMTSPLDRDPRISISTFASYEELARSYWDSARAAIEVTPEIAKLADEITHEDKPSPARSAIETKRVQARAISSWVKANIRYVFVVLGAGRVVPNSAAAVLRNRYGDCKDHAILMTALLAAKGIAAEQVLINGEAAYTLPEPATLGYLNHVIVFLPELGIYDDPTVQFAAFGVLAAAEYDKPVLHVSATRAYRARTPVMKPEDHRSIRRTELSLAADGTVSGRTEQSGTGLFATNIRGVATLLQGNGFERSAEEFLRRIGSPGKGSFEISPLAPLDASYSVRSRFTYDTRLVIKPPTNLVLPSGLGVQARPGEYVLGQRLPGRKQPFVCLAGTQIEEIELAFAEGLPLPQKINDRRIETKTFVYTAEHKLEGRTFKVRHEFVSRVPGQVCPAELEAEIAQPMQPVAADHFTRMIFPASPAPAPGAAPAPKTSAAPTPAGPLELKRTAAVDQTLLADFLYAINPDCSSIDIASVRTLEAPQHGKLTIAKGSGFSNFPQDNPRHACDRRRSEGMLMYYRPAPGFQGADSVTVEVIFADGGARKRHYAITVNPVPPPAELTRVAATEQRVRIGFLTNLDPDCSSTPFASVRIVEEPKHGEASLKEDTGFTNFPKDNPRFECNGQRSDGTAVLYRSEAGYTGKDSLTVHLVYADGRESRLRYVIDVK
jgi:Domain of Unknown Function with PDB structure (DUF3857)/Transglutaminase-like superfamily